MQNPGRLVCLVWLAVFASAGWAMPARSQAAAVRGPEVVIESVEGEIVGDALTAEVTLTVTTYRAGQSVHLLGGDVALRSLSTAAGRVLVGDEERRAEWDGTPRPARVGYDLEEKRYTLTVASPGELRLRMSVAVRATVEAGGDGWREAAWTLPASDRRPITLRSASSDLAVELPGAVRVTREVSGEGDEQMLTVSGVQGAAEAVVVRWRPTVGDLRAELVLSSEASAHVLVSDGGLRLDTLFMFDIAQGELDALSLVVPDGLNVTAVRGGAIQDWRVVEPEGDGDDRVLAVSLRLPQSGAYALQVVGEMALEAFPTRVALPVVRPPPGIRAAGHVTVGTDSAVALVVDGLSGLTQVDGAATPRVSLSAEASRPLPGEGAGPGGKAFYFSHAATPYSAELSLDHVVPAVDAEHRVVVEAREDGLVYESQVGLTVRDAPVRGVSLALPAGFTVLSVSGEGVSDYQVQERAEGGRVLSVQFAEPRQGAVTLGLRLESGEPPVGATRRVGGVTVIDAASERGHVVVSVAEGLSVGVDAGEALRQVNTAAVPFTVARGQAAYRFRGGGWSLALSATRKPATIRAEAFQLVSVGEGVAYGNVAINYFITGAPVDELLVRVDPRAENVQFVGRDVRRFDVDAGDSSLWRVRLQRRVIGDYNLGVGYYQRYAGADGAGTVLVGGVSPADAQTQTTYAAVASRLDLELADAPAPGNAAAPPGARPTLLPIAHEELPANYRLLVAAPLLRTYKAVGPAGVVELAVDPYDRGELTPAIIELAQAHTRVAPATSASGDAESTTRIRYRIKNARRQFLRLRLPQGAAGWSVHLVTTDDAGNESRQRLTVSTDPARGELMVPLPRPLDPNDPMTLELTYGEVHTGQGDSVTLEAPVADTASTYEVWTVEAADGWAATAVQGGTTMAPEPRVLRRGRLGVVMNVVGERWGEAIERASRTGRLWFALLVALAVSALGWMFLRRAGWQVTLGTLLVLAVWLGAEAANSRAFEPGLRTPETLDMVTWTRVIEQGGETGSVVAVDLQPERSFYVARTTLVGGYVVAGALVLLGLLWRPGRWVLLALGLAVAVLVSGKWPAMALPLAHAFTWGLPAVLLVAVLVSLCVRLSQMFKHRPTAQAVATAAALALSLLWLGGCAQTDEVVEVRSPTADTVLEQLDCALSAEDDAVAVWLSLSFTADEPVSFDLIGGGAILSEPPAPTPGVRLERGDTGYAVVADRPGRYALSAGFLLPLAEPDAQRERVFRLPLPPALSRRVTATLPGTGLQVEAPTAIMTHTAEQDGRTRVTTTLGPADAIDLRWRPRERRRDLEATVFYATSRSLTRLAPGSAATMHDLVFEVAQGQLSDIVLALPEGMTVTQVLGENLGAWRFHPQTHRLEARLTTPATGTYRLLLTTQTPVDAVPYTAQPGVPELLGAARQRATLGLLTTPSVYVTVEDAPQAMNPRDFSRDAALLLRQAQQRGPAPEVRFACRIEPGQRVRATVRKVLPEVRSAESATFTLEEDRLVYQSSFVVDVSKAGVFRARLLLPEGYDLDALSAPGATHWDEEQDDQGRCGVTLHYASRVIGELPVDLRLSRALTDLPDTLDVPRVEADGSLKHAGRLIIAGTRGVRLSVAQRDGVSEINPLELGIRTPGVIAINQLRPAWSVTLSVEQLSPRITAEALHVAAVADGVVRHTAYLRYALQHAGTQRFVVRLPEDALAVRLVGPGIARRAPVPGRPGVWEVELEAKWFDRPYPLAVQYDTPYDVDAPSVAIEPVVAEGTDLQRGYLAVLAGGRVEVDAAAEAGGMVRADARALPAVFGAGDLSSAALCYRCPSAGYGLTLSARRLEDAEPAQATVEHTVLTTVLTAEGASINRAQVALRVGGKRYLETRLPAGGELLALRVNGRAAEPSTRPDAQSAETVYLVPLEPAIAEDARVVVDLVYAVAPSAGGAGTSVALEGPRFDLPLRDIQWAVYAPDGYRYDGFGGSAVYREPDDGDLRPVVYRPESYDELSKQQRAERLAAAQRLQDAAAVLADEGDPRRARAALERAMYFSLGDRALNEDARVQLHALATDQAVAGLIGSRSRLRELDGGRVPRPITDGADDPAVLNLSRRDLQQVRAALSRPDGENLALIAARFMATQQAAAARPAPLVVEMPLRGQRLEFTRPIQAQPNIPVTVSFTAAPEPAAAGRTRDLTPWIVGAVLLALGLLAQWAARRKRITAKTQA